MKFNFIEVIDLKINESFDSSITKKKVLDLFATIAPVSFVNQDDPNSFVKHIDHQSAKMVCVRVSKHCSPSDLSNALRSLADKIDSSYK